MHFKTQSKEKDAGDIHSDPTITPVNYQHFCSSNINKNIASGTILQKKQNKTKKK